MTQGSSSSHLILDTRTLLKPLGRESVDRGHLIGCPTKSLIHVFFSINRKPVDSPVHFHVTTAEPYAVCCLQGLKVSMGMHNFGEKRFGSGIFDDIRSVNDQVRDSSSGSLLAQSLT